MTVQQLPDRAPRCLRLIVSKRGANRCESEQLPGASLCAHHLADAAREYAEIVARHTLGTGKENA